MNSNLEKVKNLLPALMGHDDRQAALTSLENISIVKFQMFPISQRRRLDVNHEQ